MASLLLHALLLTPVLLGGTTHKRSVANSEKLAASASSSEESALTLVLIEEPDAGAERAKKRADLASLVPAPGAPLAPVAMPDLPIMAAVDELDDRMEESGTVNPNANSDPGQAMMFGRYLGQIDARIERAWIRPRTSIAAGLFVCRVKIVQGRSGIVEEIEIVRCNGDIPWQTSLVRAIQSASPLPAPPDPDVFSRVLTLDFSSQSFSPGGDSSGFEPEARTVMK